MSLIFGQAFLFGSLWTLVYGLVVWLTVHLFVLGYEEPKLQETFGAQYDAYRAGVRRWIPRATPWRGLAKLKACRLDFIPGPLELGRDLVGVEPHVADNVVGKPREAGERVALAFDARWPPGGPRQALQAGCQRG